MVAWGIAKGGGDWQRWHLHDVARDKELDEVLEHVKYYPPVFSPDGKNADVLAFVAESLGVSLVSPPAPAARR